MIPRCRKCGAVADEIKLFQDKAKAHNASGADLKVSASTFAYGPGSHYDPSTNTFICPACKEKENHAKSK